MVVKEDYEAKQYTVDDYEEEGKSSNKNSSNDGVSLMLDHKMCT